LACLASTVRTPAVGLAAGLEGAHGAASPDRDEARIGVHLHGFSLIRGRSVAEAAATVLNWGRGTSDRP
jgi:hypothetical protein